MTARRDILALTDVERFRAWLEELGYISQPLPSRHVVLKMTHPDLKGKAKSIIAHKRELSDNLSLYGNTLKLAKVFLRKEAPK